MRKIIIIILFLLLCGPISLRVSFAQETDQPENFSMKQRVGQALEKVQNFLKEIPQKIEEKKQSEKQEIKQGIKQAIKQRVQKALNQVLNPLRDKIKEGSDWLREKINHSWNFLKNLFGK